ncbi:hypothetical protein BGZ93_008504 [Podila epicladia]|nr:hypothetical protein BGZ92_008875 [Podila epicladia]KAG0092083.1 hypothetical protein BGZ93_008504 [Podila epicladia]
MYIPGYTSSPTTDGGVLSGILLGRKPHPDTSTSSDPTSPNPSGQSLSYPHYDQEYLDSLDDEARGEYERLLARRRSTSYYDANRSRAPVPVVIRYDTKGRPISTWSTASSVAAARGEELSQWSRRRDDLIRIYGNSQRNSTLLGGFEDDLEEEPEREEQEQQQEEVSESPSASSGYYETGGRGEYLSERGVDRIKDGHLAPPS